MRQINKEKESGFTIIEVVLVLAIAGLIFLIVFLALPQLQRSRRDTQRKNDAGRLLAALENYAGNSNGDYPSGTQWTTFEDVYVDDDDFEDPSGDAYEDIAWTTGTVPTSGDIEGEDEGAVWLSQSFCDSGGVPSATGTTDRDISVVMRLEDGFYCQDNQ